jgi:hypothetical protein
MEQLATLELAPTSFQSPPKTRSTSTSRAKKPNCTNQRWNVNDKKNYSANSKFYLFFGSSLGCGNSRILALIVGAGE